ncbi:MAG TPA: ANTAR domain-containing protein [Acidimicrobiales bacterium]|nr:ANTAR domain-containing protein [Acidimicrobiales bacterium]
MSLENFGVSITVDGDEVAVSVRGEIDPATAPAFGAALESAAAQGGHSVALMLSDLTSIDTIGLDIVATTAQRLSSEGRALVIRSAPPPILRTLTIAGISTEVLLGDDDSGARRLGPEQPTGTPRSRVTVRAPKAAHYVRQVMAIPADADVVDGSLRLVVALARATIGGADGVSVSLRRHGRLATVAATDRTISAMDAGQYATGEGPCVAAAAAGRWFHVADLGAEVRWPAFTPAARALGIRSILSSPLLSRDIPVGALNIYSRTADAFASVDQELAALFAAQTSLILGDAGVVVSDAQLAERLQEAMRGRQTIALAQGVIMEREGVDEMGAYTVLRTCSQQASQPLRSWAREVVESAARQGRGDPVRSSL